MYTIQIELRAHFSVILAGHTSFKCRSALVKVVESLPALIEDVARLPRNLKEGIFKLMMKRGSITDSNIDKVLDENVRILDLSECEVGDSSLHKISSHCPHLQSINLNSLKVSRTGITSQGVMDLANGCPYLQIVYLRRCTNVTDDGIVELTRHCQHLRELNIGGCHLITDRSLQAIGENCSHISSINLSQTNVTDEGVICLARGACATSLKEIHLGACLELTDESIEAITNFCPNISILLFHGCPNLTNHSRVALEQVLGANSHMMQLTWTVY